MHKRSKGM